MTLVQGLDFAAVVVFAISGSLAASRSQLDLVGFWFIAVLTSVGGGTLRDLLLGREAVFWVANPTYILIACAVATVIFFTAHLFESRIKALQWADAFALAFAVAAGAGVAQGMNAGPIIIVFMGIATGCFGGLMRDVTCNEVPLLLKSGELYATCAFTGGLALIGATKLEIPLVIGFALCAAITFVLRAGSLIWGWSLPVYKSRPPRA